MAIPQRTNKSLLGLEAFCKSIKNSKEIEIVEIGSWVGVSSILFAKYFKHVICVDTWAKEYLEGGLIGFDINEVERTFDKNTRPYKNITKIKTTSLNFLNNNKMFDIIYLDAQHNYNAVMNELIASKDKYKIAISGHDYCKKFPGVIKAVNTVFGKPDKVFSDTSWIVYKK